MCITVASAKLSRTRILGLKLANGKHLLAYSNLVRNLAGRPNAMILPVPGELTQEDFFDTTPYANFLEKLEDGWTQAKFLSSDTTNGGTPRSIVQNFQVGAYNVFISKSALALADALTKIPADKRPKIAGDLLAFYARAYLSWNLVICCFDADHMVDAQPIMFSYEPLKSYEKWIFFPAVDAHDGLAPRFGYTQIVVDHFLCASDSGGIRMGARRFPKGTPDFICDTRVEGAKMAGSRVNGDWWYPTVTNPDVARPSLNFVRASPHTFVP
jgi:hypothetical protein